jgi:hypothetical protein
MCIYCNGKTGYYIKKTMKGEFHYAWDDTPMDSHLETIRGGKIKYCIDCRRRIDKEG